MINVYAKSVCQPLKQPGLVTRACIRLPAHAAPRIILQSDRKHGKTFSACNHIAWSDCTVVLWCVFAVVDGCSKVEGTS